ncbi:MULTISPECIES: hypothetical protein [Bacillus cereus group]|uniref:Uncharacterized protein n=1 Tax=Bacillus thuringiensis TaxID=1428 RepID=A0A1C4DHL3_BACTU|nr:MULTISPECIES: hypothetical protein [Bacillus cereus group]MED3025245.1 hypothetical protein [Bacillus wiedmannii]SCC30834.1 Uncharacterized protein BTT61001_02424 [Bacillus thuringiensis]
MKANNKGIVKYIKIQEGRHYIPKTESKTLKNLIKLIFIYMVIGFGYWCISYLDSDSPGNDDNPYNQDFDGDGIKGTKKDHEIYHKYYK